jgi:NAD(P)-dependent dehydrogenase (short-subunit alcohol dehydrogenase family)
MPNPRKAIVSGGATGAGAAIVRLLGYEGCAVTMLDRNYDAAAALVHDMAAHGYPVDYECVDVGTPEAEKRVRMICERQGGIDMLFNHAGVVEVRPFLETGRDTWLRMFTTNVLSMVSLTQAVLPYMLKAGKGSIVNTASISGLTASALESAYCVTKGACIQLTRAVAVEFRDQGIRCNAVCPGFVDTPHGRRELEDLGRCGSPVTTDDMRALQGRMCTPEEVAKAAIFLASDDASFINGEFLVVDNAAMAKT